MFETQSQKGIFSPAVFTDDPSTNSRYSSNIIGAKPLLVPFVWLLRTWICWRRQSTTERFFKIVLFLINMPVTILWCGIIVSNSTTAFKIFFSLFKPYFIFYFKNRVNVTTASIKRSFHIILGLLEVLLVLLLFLKPLGYQHLDMGVFLVNPLIFLSCINSIYLDR